MADIFADMHAAAGSRLERDEQRHTSFEDRCVRVIYKHAGLPETWNAYRHDAHETFGTRNLTFQWFHHARPAFPVCLAGAALAFTSGDRVGWTALFGKRFSTLPWVQERFKMAATLGLDPVDDAFGLVFNAPGADRAAIMVVHNHVVVDPEQRDECVTRIVHRNGRHRLTLITESLTSFLNSIGTDWAMA
jgi:hypothetical protein